VDRRVFILGSAAASALSAQKVSPSATDSDRRIYELNRGLLYGDSSEKVTLPHANVRLPWHSFDEKQFQFVSVYRRHFQALAGWKGKRVFVDFAGAMTAATVSVNGHKFPEYKGGYTPFSFELTPHLNFGGDNLLTVELDSTERQDIPPFGGNIDYLTFGGIYRDVQLRVVPRTFIENVYAKPVRPLENNRAVAVRCYLNGPIERPVKITAELRDGETVVKTTKYYGIQCRAVSRHSARITGCDPALGSEESKIV
jgi:beta-galactosidase